MPADRHPRLIEQLRSLGIDGRPLHDEQWQRFIDRVDAAYGDADREASLLMRQAEWQSSHDPLTGLPGRHALAERLDLALDSGRTRGPWPSLLYIDFDRFRQVNAAYGHRLGDSLLQAAAARIQRVVGSSDTVARVSGDEFAVLCIGGAVAATAIAARLLLEFAEPFSLVDEPVYLALSIGVAHAMPGRDRANILLHDAEIAVVEAKRKGRDRVVTCDELLRVEAAEQALMERGLREAIGQGELTVVYQPIRRIETGELTGFEALARWAHPTLGAVPPDRFIPLAERSGLISLLGARVVDLAVRDAASWLRESGHSLGVHVNLSSSELVSPTHLGRVADILARHDLDPALMTLEITDRVLLEDPRRVDEQLNAIKQLGVSLAIDDFGSGLSTLTLLRRYPLRLVKIDREFVTGVDSSPAMQRVVRCIVELAHALGYAVLAEGVETQAELEAMRTMGCEYAQGYLFGAPLPPAEALLAATSDRFSRQFGS